MKWGWVGYVLLPRVVVVAAVVCKAPISTVIVQYLVHVLERFSLFGATLPDSECACPRGDRWSPVDHRSAKK